MEMIRENTDWGAVYRYSGKNYRFALYIYNDDTKTMYLSNFRVEPKARKHGLGNAILVTIENESKKYGADNIALKVLKSSWVHDWYERKGYVDFADDKEDNSFIWMKKRI